MQVRQVCTSIFGTINSLASALPQYAWLAVLPQLTSRICHQNIEVQKATRQIITRVTQAYPQQVIVSNWPELSSPTDAEKLCQTLSSISG